MRIRKAFQGTIPPNKILDTYSTSKTDTYSCNKVNELTHPVGSIYTSQDSTNPKDLFGGEWELIRTYAGGELLAYVTVSASGGSECAQNTDVAFSDSRVGTKSAAGQHYNTGVNSEYVLGYESGTIMCYPRGIVGMVEADIYLTGSGSHLWFHGNYNTLPSGVELISGRQFLATGTAGGYGGNSNKYIYKVEGATENFFINPLFSPYNGAFLFSSGGTISWLTAKAYAKPGISYVWKRTS